MSITQDLCSYNGKLYAAWKGETGDERVFFSAFQNGAWQTQAQMPNVGGTSVGPSLAKFGNDMFVAWKGEGSDDRLFFTSLAGTTWGNQAQIPGVAGAVGPTLSEFNGRLYAAWKGAEDDDQIWYASFNGSSWSAQATIPGVATSVGPSLCVLDGRLYAAWKGAKNDSHIWYASFDGSHWSSQAMLGGAGTSTGPALALFANRMYAIWKGQAGDQSLWYSSFDGSNWAAQAQVPGVGSSVGAALAGYNGLLYAMWKGEGSDEHLWYASFDGSRWSAQATVPGNTGPDLPQNIGLRMQYQETNQWCWIAVATSIAHFYNPASTVTQCALMTTIGHAINGFPAADSACPTAAMLAANPALSGLLANPYDPSAEGCLQNVGIPQEFIKSGGCNDALQTNGNLASGASNASLSELSTEIKAGRPVAVDIQWPGGGQHCIAIAGILDDQLMIVDPVLGESVVNYDQFPTTYNGGASLVGYYFTQA